MNEAPRMIVGKSDTGSPVSFDIPELFVSNLLIEGATGSGKSYTIRKIIELLAPIVQVIVVDPDGEFATLREKFDFVLAGEGGEAPMSIRTAAMLAQKLIETRVSCVCNLYDVPRVERAEWVKRFFEALMDIPKDRWHEDRVVVLDEAHLFAPEKDKSISLTAVADLLGRGRKRGYTSIMATQRISKFNKDVTSELQNIMVGRHFMDIDRERAAETLGIGKKELPGFMAELKVLPKGVFYTLGIAVSTERIRVNVDKCVTSHPDRRDKKTKLSPPPTPDKVKHLLSALADIPAEVEKKTQTEAGLRKQIFELQSQLKRAATVAPAPPPAPPTVIEVPDYSEASKTLLRVKNEVQERLDQAFESAADFLQTFFTAEGKRLQDLEAQAKGKPGKVFAQDPVVMTSKRAVLTGNARPVTTITTRELAPPSGDISKVEWRILSALAELTAIGIDPIQKVVCAGVCGNTLNGHIRNSMGSLRSRGLVEYPTPDTIELTAEGKRVAPPAAAPLNDKELHDRVAKILSGLELKIFETVYAHPGKALSKESVAQHLGQTLNGHIRNTMGSLRSKQLVTYPDPSTISCADWLFLP